MAVRGGITWGVILRHWETIKADLHEVYGIDCDDPSQMSGRSWHWLRARINALWSMPPKLIIPAESRDAKTITIPAARIAWLLREE